MPTTATTATATTATLASSLLRRHVPLSPPPPPPPSSLFPSISRLSTSRRSLSCQVAVTSDLPSSSSSSELAEEEAEMASKIGSRVRVTAPLKVYHVGKAPDLDICGMEGAIKQYVGIWKGKRITANLPFKVEFFLKIEGQAKPVKFFAHLKEDEFEYISSDA